MKYCTKCGAQLSDNAKFCQSCGAAVASSNPTPDSYSSTVPSVCNEEPENSFSYSSEPESKFSYSTGSENNYTYNSDAHNSQSYSGTVTRGIVPRNIAVSVILSFVTCGIYMIYWMIRMNDEMNELVNDTDSPSGGLVFLLSLVTCSIYTYFWMFKMGEKCDRLKGTAGSSHILYLILTFFGLGIVSYCLIQDTINKYL